MASVVSAISALFSLFEERYTPIVSVVKVNQCFCWYLETPYMYQNVWLFISQTCDVAKFVIFLLFQGIDCNGHGTHCAGTAGSTTYGVAKNANLYGIRVLSCFGSGSWEDVAEGRCLALAWIHYTPYLRRFLVVNLLGLDLDHITTVVVLYNPDVEGLRSKSPPT